MDGWKLRKVLVSEEKRETPKGSASILVSEVERSGGRQWQPPREDPVYSPALRP